MLALLLTLSALADCGDPDALLDSGKEALLDGLLDDAQGRIDQVREAYNCMGVASQPSLCRLKLLQAVRLSMAGEEGAAALAFGSAYRCDPNVWDTDFGTGLEAAYQAALSEASGWAPGTLGVDAIPEEVRVAVDGSEVAFPTDVGAGYYLVQLERAADGSLVGRVVPVLPGEDVQIDAESWLGAATPASASMSSASMSSASMSSGPSLQERLVRPLRWTAVGSGALGLGALGYSLAQNTKMRDTQSVAELDAAYSTQQISTWTGVGLVGLGVVSCGLSVVF